MKIFCKKTQNIRQHLRSQISRSYCYLKPGNTFLSTLELSNKQADNLFSTKPAQISILEIPMGYLYPLMLIIVQQMIWPMNIGRIWVWIYIWSLPWAELSDIIQWVMGRVEEVAQVWAPHHTKKIHTTISFKIVYSLHYIFRTR